MKRILGLAVLILILGTIFLAPLNWRELFTPDETRYAEIAREMIVRNDWITPYLNGIKYFEKPIFGYWCIAASMKTFGENAFAVRLPSALALLLSALCVFLLAKKFRKGDPKLPWLASGLFLVCPYVFGLGGIAVLDGMFACFLTLGMTLFYFALDAGPWTKRGLVFQFTCGLAFGIAFLTKGFLAFALPGAAFFFYFLIPEDLALYKSKSWWLGRLKLLFTLPWIPLAGVLIAALPWSIAVHLKEPHYWNYFFWEEHIQRFTEEKQHPNPPWYFIPVFAAALGFLWVFVFGAVRGYSMKLLREPLVRYALCWTVFMFLFLSMSTGKLPTYILPCFPAAILLLAYGIHERMFIQGETRWTDRLLLGFGLFLCVLTAGFLIYNTFAPADWRVYSPREWPKQAMFAFSALVLGGAMMAASRIPDVSRKFILFGLGMIPAIVLWQGLVPEMMYPSRVPDVFLRRVKARLGKVRPEILCFRNPIQSACWVFRRDDVSIFLMAGELTRGLEFTNAQSRLLGPEEGMKLIREKRDVLMILPREYLDNMIKLKILPKYDWCEPLDPRESEFAAVKFSGEK